MSCSKKKAPALIISALAGAFALREGVAASYLLPVLSFQLNPSVCALRRSGPLVVAKLMPRTKYRVYRALRVWGFGCTAAVSALTFIFSFFQWRK